MSLNERCDQRLGQQGWQKPEFDDSSWTEAVFISARSLMMPMLEPRKLCERPIPELPEIESRFLCAIKSTAGLDQHDLDGLLLKDKPITVPANTEITIDIQAEVLTTGFIRLDCDSGAGAVINILYAESYEHPINSPNPNGLGAKRLKTDRMNWKSGELYGPADTYTTAAGKNVYEPFWFSTFRFVRLKIQPGNQPLTLTSFGFRETHYPLEIGTQLHQSSDHKIDALWKISLNTLRNCMHETYEDCPFYEQNQFAMDSRVQILFTYQLSRDDRLARKTMHEFYASRRDDGLVATHFPLPFRGVNIPQFSLYWVLMVADHMKYFGDSALVRRYAGTVDGILDYFTSRLDYRGLVGRFDDEAWPFVDWVQQWHGNKGLQSMAIPPCYHGGDGVVTYNSLIVVIALNNAADLNTFIGRHGTANEYRACAQSLNDAVNKYCFDENQGLYVDGPSTKDVCQHSQVFAILSGAISGEPAQELFKRTVANLELPKCSYSMSFYVLRAASKSGLYEEYFDTLFRPWNQMIENNLTTWAEDDVMFRSDCHGWSSSPIYEIVHEIFGVSIFNAPKQINNVARPIYDGNSKLEPEVRIAPRFGLQQKAKGTFVIKDGTVDVSWDISTGLVIRPSRAVVVEVLINGKEEHCEILAGEERLFKY